MGLHMIRLLKLMIREEKKQAPINNSLLGGIIVNFVHITPITPLTHLWIFLSFYWLGLNLARFQTCNVTKKGGTPRMLPGALSDPPQDPVMSSQRPSLSATSLTCYSSRAVVQDHTMQLAITQMESTNLMPHNITNN
jgi:hypothetical protein